MTAPRRATVVRRMLPHQGRPEAVCANSSTSSAPCTGADVARASYQPPAPLGPTAETDATAHNGRAEGLAPPVGAGTTGGPKPRSCRADRGCSHLTLSRHSISAHDCIQHADDTGELRVPLTEAATRMRRRPRA